MGTRIVYDKRTLRRKYAGVFVSAIAEYSARGSFLDEVADTLGGDPAPSAGDEPVQVFARKRPLFREEAERGEFDVVTASPHGVLVHACRMRPDLRSPYLATHYSPLYAFDELSSNAEVVDCIRLDKLLAAAAAGGDTALCCFGQTGSGKSFTMAAVLRSASRMLFGPSGLLARTGLALELAAYEVAGPAVHDLQADRARLRLREAPDGSTFVNAAARPAPDAAALSALLQAATRARATAATARNPGSSRTHAFYELRLVEVRTHAHRGHASPARALSPGRGGSVGACTLQRGSVLFVDLAGAERAADSAEHDAERQAQSADINSGLRALKECFRARNLASRCGGEGVRIPYRESALSRLMKRVLESAQPGARAAARVVVIATISPCASDTEASLNTLRHAAVMAGLAALDRDSDMLLEETDLAAARPRAAPLCAPDGGELPSIRGGSGGGAAQQTPPPPPQQQHQRQLPHHHHNQHPHHHQHPAGAAADGGRSGRWGSAAPLGQRPSPGYYRSSSGGGGGGSGSGGGLGLGPRAAHHSASRTPLGGRLFTPPDSGRQGRGCDYDQQPFAPGAPRPSPHTPHYGLAGSARAAVAPDEAAPSPLPPVKWSPAEVRHWVCEVGGGRFRAAAAALPPSVDGKALSRFPELRFKQLFGGEDAATAARRGRALFELFREEVRTASAQRMQRLRDERG
ncbi:hypothetical protein Rsub_12173 [Raphidocelis subcapitata]|uniref:Kinesin-like protein n=1 Tax=Raphidocelis subcapitata TaxID=307507 RepID=A0A2V0PIG7_9CHLO|nr:hypothetical protein Rsub_12173 [Raphidocelis subcapitata]|eukprot:GBF99369.1 hypothetical protein Rsub_12173 [Raphidocelis subcapitata]